MRGNLMHIVRTSVGYLEIEFPVLGKGIESLQAV